MRFRPATRDDLPIVAELKLRADATHADWLEDPKLRTLEEELPEWERRFEAWMEVAVDDENRILGVCAFAQARVDRVGAPIPGRGHVNAVFVDPPHFRKGIARLLLQRAEQAMREQGLHEAQLWTLEGSPAERLYAAAGWERDGRREIYPPMGVPVVAYVKTLTA